MIDKYVQAVKELLASGQQTDTVLVNLQTVLKQKGHSRLYRAILETLLRDLSRQVTKNTSKVTVVSERAALSQKDAIKNVLDTLGADLNYEITTDENMVGGYVVEANGLRIDNSYKTALLNLYRKITS